MLNSHQLAILLDVSLALVEEGTDQIDLKKVLSKIVRSLNCGSGRIYYYYQKGKNYKLELKQSLPRIDTQTDQFIGCLFSGQNELTLNATRFNELVWELPKTIELNGTYYHLFHLENVGFGVLKCFHNEIHELFLKTLDQIMDKLAIILEKERVKEEAKVAKHFSMIGQISSGISHEIKNPLAILLGFIKQITREHSQNNYKNTDLYVSYLLKSAQRIEDIITCLTLLSRDESRQDMEQITLNNILDDCKFFSQNLVTKSGIPITFPSNLDSKLKVVGRPMQISQVITNLIKNSVDEIKKQDDPWIRIEVKEEAENILVKVIDSGKGIDPDNLDQIMNPFFTTKEKEQGTGLGLSLSQKILEAQDGILYYDDCADNTTFIVQLNKP